MRLPSSSIRALLRFRSCTAGGEREGRDPCAGLGLQAFLEQRHSHKSHKRLQDAARAWSFVPVVPTSLHPRARARIQITREVSRLTRTSSRHTDRLLCVCVGGGAQAPPSYRRRCLQ